MEHPLVAYGEYLALPILIFVLGGLVYAFSLGFRRRRSMRDFARSRGLEWVPYGLPTDLPNDFPLQVIEDMFDVQFFNGWYGVNNLVADTTADDYRMAFDLEVRIGQRSVTRTVVARRQDVWTGHLYSPRGYRAGTSGSWRLITPNATITGSALVGPAAIEDHWAVLRDGGRLSGSYAGGDRQIRIGMRM